MSITANILRGCKDGLGGMEIFYILPWYKYSRSEIVTTEQLLTTFPTSTAYSVAAENVSFNETSSFEGGSEKWTQTMTFEIPKTDVSNELYKLLRQNIRIFYEDRLGNLRVLGLYNGLESQITTESGVNKSDLNGYRVTTNGIEDNQAYYMTSLPIFIAPDVPENYIFQDGNNKIYQNGNNAIFN
tara:strand:+ start:5499 stop:6053 length:555 start_codon:yes stop_codon:yes gene_type:complete